MKEENRGEGGSQARIDREEKGEDVWKMPVYARVRPLRIGREGLPIRLRPLDLEDSGKLKNQVVQVKVASDQLTSLHYVNNHRENYQFIYDGAYGPSTDQETIFAEVAEPVIDSCLAGFNGTIFAYGQTGSGKTYTMTGGETYPERGLV